MDLKSFLLPGRLKLFLSAAIYLVGVSVVPVGQYCIYGEWPGNGCTELSALGLFLTNPRDMLPWVVLLAGLPLSYLASCSLAFLAAKSRPK